MSTSPPTVGVGTPLPRALVGELRARLGDRLTYDAELLGEQRWTADHRGNGDPANREMLVTSLREHDVVLGVPGDSGEGLAELLAPGTKVSWVQGTAAGVGEQTRKSGLSSETLAGVAITSSAGVHATPLAEFAVWGLLTFHKDLDRLLALRADRSWPARWEMTQISGRRLLLLGLGGIGAAVAVRAQALGMKVTGVRRNVGESEPDGVDAVVGFEDLPGAAAEHDDLVVALPGTLETEKLVDATLLAALRPGGVVVNVGRGSCIDEAALREALDSGHLRGAVLDVAAEEPRPPSDPIWDYDNVIQSPHTAALSSREDHGIVALFLANLERYEAGEELVNEVRTDLFY